MITHYHRAFSSVGLCGASGPHSLTPTCLHCKVMILLDDAPMGVLDGLADAIESEIEKRLTVDGDEEMKSHGFDSRTPYEPGDDRDIWCKHCEYHRDHQIHANSWTAVPLPPDVETLLARDYPSPPCRDGSTEACVPGTTDVGRCVYCGRGLL